MRRLPFPDRMTRTSRPFHSMPQVWIDIRMIFIYSRGSLLSFPLERFPSRAQNCSHSCWLACPKATNCHAMGGRVHGHRRIMCIYLYTSCYTWLHLRVRAARHGASYGRRYDTILCQTLDYEPAKHKYHPQSATSCAMRR